VLQQQAVFLIAARLGRHGLSEGRFVLLVVLLDAPDGLSPHGLAEHSRIRCCPAGPASVKCSSSKRYF
jgi:hypothetical protein